MGFILTAQIFIYLLLNAIDLDLIKFGKQKDKEAQGLEGQEVL